MAKTKYQFDHVSKASLRGVRISARKARLVCDLIRGKSVSESLTILENSDKKAAELVKGVLMSAVSNAAEGAKVQADELYVKASWADEGKSLKRFMSRAQGRATPMIKRSSHINVVLDEYLS